MSGSEDTACFAMKPSNVSVDKEGKSAAVFGCKAADGVISTIAWRIMGVGPISLVLRAIERTLRPLQVNLYIS